ncbi:hypothetical protein [Thermochromatium tepidum]|uniref:hypothetical protein n=1 Tax=Thermochromatium tepidum TaxID=1050 RepID=UPI001FEBC55D|nr:hypothetical protein [Thermochromatium tepidum]
MTGTQYDQARSRITGPFNLGGDRVTGTESFRARRAEEGRVGGQARAGDLVSQPEPSQGEVSGQDPSTSARPRITGEGMDGRLRITGDDWGRNERVTGTEGQSVQGRNPTWRGSPAAAFAGARLFRTAQWQDRPKPETRITGSSGSTERGALVTLSGGARG